MMPVAQIVHQSRGRIRLQVRERCKDPDFFEAARKQLDVLAGIDEVTVNCRTGSIVLMHSLQDNAALMNLLEKTGIFEIKQACQPETSAFKPLRTGLSTVEQLLKNGTDGSVDLRTVAFIGVMGVTIHQILRGQVLGPALPMLWNAYGLIDRIGSNLQDTPPVDTDTV